MCPARRYYPKRPVKSFQDLDVYQKTFGLSVEVAKQARMDEDSSVKSHSFDDKKTIKKTAESHLKAERRLGHDLNQTVTANLLKTVLQIPVLIATAHSLRFGDSQKAIQSLEKAMLACNLAVVYIEQYRDIVCPTFLGASGKKEKTKTQKVALNVEYWQEQINQYLRIRGRILRLQKAWCRFINAKTS